MGFGQFVEDTWLRYVRQASPAWAQGLSREQILAQRNDPQKAQEATLWLAERNAETMRARLGRDPLEFEIGLAHELGPAAAAAVARAAPDAPLPAVLEQALGADWARRYVTANPHYARLTAGQMVNRVQGAFAPAGGPRVAPQAGPPDAVPPAGAPDPQAAPAPAQAPAAVGVRAGSAPQAAAPPVALQAAPPAAAAAPAAITGRLRGNPVLASLSTEGLAAFQGMLAADPEKALSWLLQQEGTLANRQTRTVTANGRVFELLPDGSLGRDYGSSGSDAPRNTQTIVADGRVREVLPGGELGRDYGAASDRDDKGFERTRALRTDYTSSSAVQAFNLARPNIEAIRESQGVNSIASDLNLVFAFAKLLDPTSVVREGEAATIQRTGGVFDTLQGYVSRLTGGAALTPDVRAALRAEAEGRFRVYEDDVVAASRRFREMAQRAGLNPEDVAPEVRPTGRPRRDSTDLPADAGTRPGNGWTQAALTALPANQLAAAADYALANPDKVPPAERAAIAREIARRNRR